MNTDQQKRLLPVTERSGVVFHGKTSNALRQGRCGFDTGSWWKVYGRWVDWDLRPPLIPPEGGKGAFGCTGAFFSRPPLIPPEGGKGAFGCTGAFFSRPPLIPPEGGKGAFKAPLSLRRGPGVRSEGPRAEGRGEV